MPTISSTVKTQLGLCAWGTRRYGSFANKSAAAAICITATYSTSLTSAATFDIVASSAATYTGDTALTGTWDEC